MNAKILQGDVLQVLKTMPDESVDCIITSPPYYGLRDYGVEGQIGLEKTLAEFIDKMLLVTAELKRVLKKEGTMWWNHGDSYAGSGKGFGDKEADPKFKSILRGGGTARSRTLRPEKSDIPAKSLMLQAHRLVIRMVDEQGWILRNQIIWHKPNVMPSSVNDRFTVDFEPIFFFSKSKKYWFEQQHEPQEDNKFKYRKSQNNTKSIGIYKRGMDKLVDLPYGRKKRAVWKIATKPFKEAHFATFPEALIETPIKAGCPEFICKKCNKPRVKLFKKEKFSSPGQPPVGTKQQGDKFTGHKEGEAKYGERYEVDHIPIGYTDCGCNAGWRGGVVLDPFMGAGTTLKVALDLDRQGIGIELNPEYIKIAEDRLKGVANKLF